MQLDGCDEGQEGVMRESTEERKACHDWHVEILPILLKISVCGDFECIPGDRNHP